ncbi:hypothetical protein FACS1894176_03220 [Bacteroidia bacterium]|nr:hypothetical protein FACS1894176_03220 [Bacteroidia bacterium]
MKKVILLALIAIVGVATANAQLQFGVKAGLNVSNLSGLENDYDESGVDYSNPYKLGFHVGVAAQYLFTPQVGIETGLYYSALGAKQEYKISEAGYHATLATKYNPSYLQLPISVLYKFGIGQDLSLYPSVGIYLGYGLGGKAKLGLEDTNIPVDELDIDEEEYDFFGKTDGEEWTNRFDYGATFGLTLQYTNYTIGLGYDLGLAKINKESESGVKDLKNANIKVSVGYLF